MSSKLQQATSLLKKGLAQEDLSLRQHELKNCLRLYNEAFQTEKMSSEDYVSSMKNMGTACWSLVFSFDESSKENRIFYTQEACTYFSTTFLNGSKIGRPNLWLDGLEEKISEIFEFHFVDERQDRKSTLRKCLLKLPNEKLKAMCCFKIGRITFNQSVLEYEKKNWKICLSLLNECAEDFREGLKYASIIKNEDLVTEINDYIERGFVMYCSCEALRTQAAADLLFGQQIFDSENPNMDMIWQLVDMYKEAVLLTRGKDIEVEAICLSKIGKIFDKILKMKQKSHEYYRKAFDLSQTLVRNLSSHEWYQECLEALQRYQQEISEEEEKQKEKENAPYLRELEPELNAIKEIVKEASDVVQVSIKLLKHLYEKHPPKTTTHAFKDPETKTKEVVKKLLSKALLHYHPDKQSAHAEDRKWIVFCEEITKSLSHFFDLNK